MLDGQEYLRVQAGRERAGQGLLRPPGRGERHQVGPSGEPLGVLLRRLHSQGGRATPGPIFYHRADAGLAILQVSLRPDVPESSSS